MTRIIFPLRQSFAAFLLCMAVVFSSSLFAQLPQPNIIYMNFGSALINGTFTPPTDTMLNYNPLLPVNASNPSLNTIRMPPQAAGLAISPVLGSGSSTLTYYTTVNLHFWYYDPVTSVWVDTGDSTGTSSTVNIGAGGGFIYSMQPLGNFPSIFKYDGTGDATFVGTVPSSPRPFDVAVDCAGNYYVISNIGPFWNMTKHDPNGTLVQAYTVSNPSIYSFSGGLAIIGNDVYADDFNSGGIAHGAISGNTVNFTNISATVPFTQFGHSIGDFATLPFDASGSLPTLTIAASDTVICSGSIAHFVSNASIGGGQFQWKVNGTAIANATNDSFLYAPNNNDIITCEMSTNGACAGITVISQPLTIHVQPAPAASFTLVASACANDTVIAVADTPLNIVYQWNFDGASVLSGSGAGPYELVWNTAGNHTVSLQAGQGNCIGNASKSIAISDVPVLKLTAENTTVCLGDTVSLLAVSANNQIVWFDGSNYTLFSTEANGAKVLPKQACTVFAKATNSAGCSITKGIDIHIAEHCCVVLIPSAFSPNSDGLNDVFQPMGKHFNIQSFKVFDRWGEVVFSGYNNNAGWNGTHNGKAEDIGSYFYSIKYSCLESGNTIERKGDVTLIR